ncbi:homologous-pairing protein 2 homolog [Anthonomus grandis grandis]|uniref:homologous-pairing protein 2 homolog n=1 Tax=Anthonomus grandis grandis TaxID=2921223 RepID=UPI0021668E89|nr:homologous-pairing protein 2 homolog [Anthonomus grandis grandis]
MEQKVVLQFLEEQNRPYSLIDIQGGIKGSDIGKTTIQKALDALVENEQVRVKVYGKQKVYFIAQSTDMSSNDLNEAIIALDRQINELVSNIQESTQKLKQTTAQHEKTKGKLTLAEACEKKVQLESRAKDLKDQLKKFEGIDPVKPEVKKKVEQNYEKNLGLFKKRKRMCLDIIDAILENYPKTKKQLYEDVGIETDEDAGFSVDRI